MHERIYFLSCLFLCIAASLAGEPSLLRGIFKESTPPIPLTLEAAKQIALEKNPSAKAASAGYYSANESVGVAQSAYYPSYGFDWSYQRFQQHLFFPPIPAPIPIPTILGPFNNFTIQATSRLLVYDFGRRRAQLMVAVAQEGIAQEEISRIEQQILLDVSLAYFDLAASKELYEVAVKNLERAEDHVKVAKDRKKAGAVPLVDVLQSQVSAAQNKQSLVKAKNHVRIALGNLHIAMGLPPGYMYDVLPENMKIISPDTIDVEEGMEVAASHRPEIAQGFQRLEVYQQKIKEARSEFGPKITADGYYGRQDDTYYPKDPYWSFGITFHMPLFDGFRDVHNTRKAQADYCQEVAQFEKLKLSIVHEVWDAYSKLTEAYESIQTAIVQVADAKESQRLASERYKSGAGTLLDMLDNDTALARAEAVHVEAHWNYNSAYTKYLWSQGLLIPQLCDDIR
jgi:outer membrane protein TolC